jgi:uncharacterized membrane protein
MTWRAWARGPAGWGVAALGIFTLVALVGYGVFGLNPHRIPPSLLGFWQISYAFFAQVHIVLGALVLAVALVPWAGVRWVPSLVAVFLLSFSAEHLGTGTGLPFGEYSYTALLGARMGDRVPWLIPLSWFLMAFPSWVMARHLFPERRVPRLLFAAVLLTLWDLALDPAMSYQAPYYWQWADPGPYYGMPWINLAGWMGTGLLLMAAMEALGARRWGVAVPPSWAAAYYGVTLLMPFGMLMVEGLWGAVVVTVVAYGVAGAVAWKVLGRGDEAGGAVRTEAAPPVQPQVEEVAP